MKPSSAMRGVAFACVATLAAIALLTPLACTPGSGVSVSESDVIVSLFDDSVDFGALKTFSMQDTIFHLSDEDSLRLGRENDALIISMVRNHFLARNYQEVPFDPAGANPPDFEIALFATAVETWGVSSWPCYPYWPSYWCWYPPVSASYRYTTGTLMVDMISRKDADTTQERLPVYWEGAQTGVLDDTPGNVTSRVVAGIDQMFAQSPYLVSRK